MDTEYTKNLHISNTFKKMDVPKISSYDKRPYCCDVVDGRVLNRVINLPKAMQDIYVEVTIKPAEKQSNPKITKSELRAMLKGSHKGTVHLLLSLDMRQGAVQINQGQGNDKCTQNILKFRITVYYFMAMVKH